MRKVKVKTQTFWEWLAKKNRSQNELARMLGISSGYLSQLVNSNRCPSPELRRRMLETMSPLDFEDLFELVDSVSQN